MLSLRPSFSRTAFFLNVPIFLELRLILNPLFICLHLPLEEKTTRDIGNGTLTLLPMVQSSRLVTSCHIVPPIVAQDPARN